MDISVFVKPNKNIVIELDEVEYLITDVSVTALRAGDKSVALVRLFDKIPVLIPAERIEQQLLAHGVTDYLDATL